MFWDPVAVGRFEAGEDLGIAARSLNDGHVSAVAGKGGWLAGKGTGGRESGQSR